MYIQHISVRVPWQDTGWDGSVCRNPLSNSSCVLLKNIGTRRDDFFEIGHAGEPIADLEPNAVPCVDERATFLSARDHLIERKHPYAYGALANIAPANLTVPAWSVHAIPYYWLHRNNVESVREQHRIDDYNVEAEDEAREAIGFSPNWVLHGDNQKAMIEAFFRDVAPENSLVFFYLKHSPFDDAGARVLVGAALIDRLSLPARWPLNGTTPFPNHMWETTVRHTLRPDGTGGVLLPLQELAALADGGADVSAALAAAPEHGRAFSYVTEHVPADTAVAALLELRRAADAAIELGCSVPDVSLRWLDEQLAVTWERRGPSPGLPAVLPRLGWSHPAFAAHRLMAAAGESGDPWTVLVDALDGRREARPEAVELVTDTRRRIWNGLDDEHKRVLRLLARFDLSATAVERVLDDQAFPEIRPDALLRNPYLLVTGTVDDDEPIPFGSVDRGCRPDPGMGKRHPLPVDQPIDDPLDPRRVEAALTHVVGRAEDDGHTLLPAPQTLERVAGIAPQEPIELTTTLLGALGLAPADLDDDPEPSRPLGRCVLKDDTPAYKLRSAIVRAQGIIGFLDDLKATSRYDVPADLDAEIDALLGDLAADDPAEQRARQEKRAALRELYCARFTLLNGPAGTGKTTLVRALVHRPEVQRRGVLLLAPTGKARVQLERKAGVEARTLAQFLTRTKRYDGTTGRYRATDESSDRQRYGTVVVDEASMLTEEMLDALLDALHPPDRLILVGDPRQLPPIGAGRPFVDLEQVAHELHDGSWPRVRPGWAELTVLRRQTDTGTPRDDLMLARWFSGDELPEGYDEVWHRLRAKEPMGTLDAVAWNGRTAARTVDSVLADEFGVDATDGGRSFAASYGATVGQWVDFREAPQQCERWQILSPVRGHGHGTVQLNRHLKLTHGGNELRKARERVGRRRVPKPLGSEQIVLGDKVVNVVNQRLPGWSRAEGKSRAYVANGEIGVVVGQLARAGSKPPWATQVEFSSQPGLRVTVNSAVSDSDADVELAWALTVHKAQGSEFGTVLLVLPAVARGLSRELLYTALTRQTARIVLCHEGPLDDLIALTRATGSDAARRFTDLVRPPNPCEARTPDGRTVGLLDANLVHLTGGGVLVRSKNEVIVADILDDLAAGAWVYEQPLVGTDGRTRLPDFTISAPDGRTVYWEHLGMLDDPGYAANWTEKKRWYAEQGVLPLDDGGGPDGVLVWTDDRGGVDVPAWRELARSFLGGGPVRPDRGRRRRRT